jgi:L-ascorbate metabolism protein UlaG (beta-lactamase superfamily)
LNRDVKFITEDHISDVAESTAQNGLTVKASCWGSSTWAANVELYHCSIRARHPRGGVGRGALCWVVQDRIKDATVSEGVRHGRGGNILIETL